MYIPYGTYNDLDYIFRAIHLKQEQGSRITWLLDFCVFVSKITYINLVHVIPNTNENSIWIKLKQPSYHLDAVAEWLSASNIFR